MSEPNVSDRLSAMLRVMIPRSGEAPQSFVAKELSEQSGIPLGTVSGLINRASSYDWLHSELTGAGRGRAYRLRLDKVGEVYEAVHGKPMPNTFLAAAARTRQRPVGPAPARQRPVTAVDDGRSTRGVRVRTLTDLVATEDPELVERICAQMSWDSPYRKKPTRKM